MKFNNLSEKIGYALGDAAAGGITWKIMSIAFPLFFTNVFGLTFADAAALMLIARMFDVVTDPIMGSLADRTQTRWGTYRPWLPSLPTGRDRRRCRGDRGCRYRRLRAPWALRS